MFTKNTNRMLAVIVTIVGTPLAFAGDFELTSYTVDCGGGISVGGTFEVSGTVGQPDAEYFVGGAFELEGGFWVNAATLSCGCLGDMNGDGVRNGVDIQNFVSCYLQSVDCACADMDQIDGITSDDINAFVSSLLAATPCS